VQLLVSELRVPEDGAGLLGAPQAGPLRHHSAGPGCCGPAGLWGWILPRSHCDCGQEGKMRCLGWTPLSLVLPRLWEPQGLRKG